MAIYGYLKTQSSGFSQQTLGTRKPLGSKDFTVTIHYMTEAISDMQPNANELVFNKEIMNKLYEAGLFTSFSGHLF